MHSTAMVRLAATAIGVLGSTGLACAADLPVKAPIVAPATAYNWTGVYGGVHAGYGGGMKDWSGINFPAHGGLAGVQVGINQQIGNWVVGVEAEGTWPGLKGARDEEIAIPFS